jgi:hypothetical protein
MVRERTFDSVDDAVMSDLYESVKLDLSRSSSAEWDGSPGLLQSAKLVCSKLGSKSKVEDEQSPDLANYCAGLPDNLQFEETRFGVSEIRARTKGRTRRWSRLWVSSSSSSSSKTTKVSISNPQANWSEFKPLP